MKSEVSRPGNPGLQPCESSGRIYNLFANIGRDFHYDGDIMKINPSLRRLILLSAFVAPTSLQALEVHEWGTFTVLVSSDGRTANWYQPYSDIAQLPSFTYYSNRMKSGFSAAKVRMETPVIYFYPEEEMNVEVKVLFQNGDITERFPAAMHEDNGLYDISKHERGVITSYAKFQRQYDSILNGKLPTTTTWSGKLLPPSHPDSKLIPSVAGHKGENYGAAREVPDAWVFHSDTPVIKGQDQPEIHPVEKFIFYRGVGQEVPPYHVTMQNEQTLNFSNYSLMASSFQVALRVRDGQASWIQIPSLPVPIEPKDREAQITFPEKTIPLAQADKELGELFLTNLTKHGLTQDEAKAMIKTWNHTWFSEPGVRVFTIVDRTWVDAVLPLGISPSPQKTERVFVARYEIISPETEDKLAALLQEKTPSDQAIENFKALQLGRFANGAAELVTDRQKNETLSRFSTLNQKLAERAAK